MPKYYGDQNKVGLLIESGTYAVTSGTTGRWLGLVTGNDIDDSTGVIVSRYVGTASRNVARFDDGPLDYTGVLTYVPQDLRLLGYALGSMVDGGSPSPYTHTLSEINNNAGNAFASGTHIPFMSFTLEDARVGSVAGMNFVRTYKGCVVDSWSLKGEQGGLLEASASWIAQSVTYSSGTTTTTTEDSTSVPYKWSHVTFHLPSGTVYPEIKSFDFTINNNFDKSHYLNGSRVIATPQATNRDYELNITLDMEATRSKALYEQYFIGGSEFNCILAANAFSTTGSQDFAIVFSGCKIMDMSAPTTVSEASENTVTIQPKNAVVAINDFVQLYNPW